MFKNIDSKSRKDEVTAAALKRSIARKLARPLSPEELESIAAGTTSCSCGRPDDCDLLPK